MNSIWIKNISVEKEEILKILEEKYGKNSLQLEIKNHYGKIIRLNNNIF